LAHFDIAPPRRDEFEVSIFGPGIGECVVLHLGENEWIVIDSCLDKTSEEPVALQYFRHLGITVENAVKLIAVTHWHDDHIRGTSKLLNECQQAAFVCPVAFLADEFSKLIDAFHTRFLSLTMDSGTDEFAEIMMLLRREHAGPRPQAERLRYAIADKVLLKMHDPQRAFPVTMYALAPSDASVTLALNSFRELLPKEKTPKRRAVALFPNHVSAAFWVTAGDSHVLLGGDVEVGGNDGLGWRAVIKSTTRPAGRAAVVKVPHHGSKSAYHAPMWEKMTDPDPVALLTPFASGAKPLPSDENIKTIKKHTHQLFCTGNPKGLKPPRRDSTSDKFIDSVVFSRRRIEGPMGHVCVRFSGGDSPMVHVTPPALAL
jgi:beta-lactamase superfamily II metal-dependent hydrolase